MSMIAARPGLLALLIVAWSNGTAIAAERVTLTVDLHVEPCPRSARYLARMESEVTRAFSKTGVALEWRHNAEHHVSQEGPAHFDVIMVCGEVEARTIQLGGIPPHVLGETLTKAARAYVFFDRAFDTALRYNGDVASILGHVVVHEIGHFVLPGQGHSQHGIMRANLDVRNIAPQTFTPEERAAIRTRLQETSLAEMAQAAATPSMTPRPTESPR